MNLAKFSVHRPIFTTMVALIVIILGAISLMRLPIDLLPDITYPTISVRTTYENASPEEMEELVTRPIEEAVSAVPGVETVTSISAEGTSSVRSAFTWGTDLDAAANDIRDRVDRVGPRLPEEADKPMVMKFDLGMFPILILGASSNLDPVQLRRIIEDQIKYRIERVPGVAALDIFGGLEREIHVNLNPEKIKALGLPLDLILARVKEGNINLPGGLIDRGNYEIMVRTPGQYGSLRELEDTVIAIRQGAPIQLKEIATVEDSWQKVREVVRVDGRPGIRLAVRKQSGTNTVQVARAALREIERVNQDIPQVRLTTLIDTSDYIERSVKNVGSSALYGGALAILILLFFLRNVASTLVIATTIPISIIATFALMYFGGLTLNLMTLGGLALGVGMLVDNAIVVLENTYRLRENGLDPERAAVEGSGEVVTAIIASTLTTLVVFLPLIFVRGIAGVMFKQLSVVVSFSLLCSLVAAVTLVPMLCVKLIHGHTGEAAARKGLRGLAFRACGAFLTWLDEFYGRFLRAALGHRFLVVLAALALLGASLAMVKLIGVEFMPATDEGDVRVNVEMEPGTRLALFDQKLRRVEDIVGDAVPEMRNIVTRIGGTPWRAGGVNTAEIRIALKPQAERTRSSEQIAQALRTKLANMPGLTIRTRAGEGLFILRMMTMSGDRIEVEVRGHDLAMSDALAQRVKAVVESVPGVTDVKISRELGSPEEFVMIDRQKAADMRLTVSQIAHMIQTVLSGTEASRYREAGDEFAIRVKLKDPERMAIRDILDLTITNAVGEPVVLRNVVSVQPRTGPMLIERKNQERIVLVAANYTGRDLGSIIADIRQGLRTIPVPRDFSLGFSSDYEEQQKAFKELLLSFVLAIVLVYMVMACQYESLRDPFVVMFSVPLAGIGVIVTLVLTDTTFNIQSFIGCIMLGGIVVNNAILLVDYTNLLRRRDGMPLFEAVVEAGRRRLRPILMTTTTTLLGLFPLALGLREGGEAQSPMARTVIGGLISSTLITLVLVPSVYYIFERGLGKKGHEPGQTQ